MDVLIDDVCDKFGFAYHLKPEQKHLITSLVNGKHGFGLLPTGFGKSDCYALVPLVKDHKLSGKQNFHISLIISPLRSLMIDQVHRYNQKGVSAVAILRKDEMSDHQIKALQNGEYTLVYISPEALFLEPWFSSIRALKDRISVVALDEAHCLSSWGKDFRKSYLRVAELRSILPKAPLLMLTATATQQMVDDIFKSLCLSQAEVTQVAVLPDRPNIFLDVRRTTGNIGEAVGWVADEVKDRGDESPKTIIYARSVDTVVNIYAALMRRLKEKAWSDGVRHRDNSRVEMFHGSTEPETQEKILHNFKRKSALKVVVATVAFGLGVQVDDVDRVVHWGAARTILGYWQECGRCARDGRSGTAILYLPPEGLNSSQVSQDMVQAVRETEANHTCFRKAILSKLFVRGMECEELANCSSIERCCSLCSSGSVSD